MGLHRRPQTLASSPQAWQLQTYPESGMDLYSEKHMVTTGCDRKYWNVSFTLFIPKKVNNCFKYTANLISETMTTLCIQLQIGFKCYIIFKLHTHFIMIRLLCDFSSHLEFKFIFVKLKFSHLQDLVGNQGQILHQHPHPPEKCEHSPCYIMHCIQVPTN